MATPEELSGLSYDTSLEQEVHGETKELKDTL